MEPEASILVPQSWMQLHLFAPFFTFLQEGGVPTTDSLGSKSDNSAQVRNLKCDKDNALNFKIFESFVFKLFGTNRISDDFHIF